MISFFVNSTSSIDECSAVCPSATVRNISIISNCTLYFTPTKSGVWYVLAIQVNHGSTLFSISELQFQ